MRHEADWDQLWRLQSDRMRRWPSEQLVRWASRLERGSRVLEVGCGNGANLWFLAWEGFSAAGCDISPSAIDQARMLLEHFGAPDGAAPVELRVAPAHRLPFDDAGFDAVCDVQCLSCLNATDLAEAYREAARVLRPGGRFFSMHMDPVATDIAEVFPDIGPQTPWSRPALEAAGISVSAVDRLVRVSGGLTVAWDLISGSLIPVTADRAGAGSGGR